MATFGEIQAEVQRIVEDRVTALDAAIPTHVRRAQRAIEDRCAFKCQNATTTIQVTGSTLLYDKPDDFIGVREAPRFLDRSDATKYQFITEVDDTQAFGLDTEEGVPRYWQDYDEEQFKVWPRSDGNGPSGVSAGAYEVVFPYFKRLETLEEAGDSNFWSEKMDDVLAWRAVAFLFAELRDPMANWWASVSAARFLEIRRQYRRQQLRSRAFKITPTENLSGGANSLLALGRRTWISDIP